MNRYFGLHMLEGEWHALLPRYLLLAERVEGRRILDIGCGSGIGASLLLELGAEMVDAIDHRPAVLELARMKHAKQGLDFHVMFWEELDFPDDTFDLVLCLDPSSPVTDPSLLQEVDRVLRPGGEYVCAIERTPIKGLEMLLPRYGYADAAENIDIHSATERPPQVGELQKSFATSRSVVQRPSLSFIFDVDPAAVGDNSEAMRKVNEGGESGVWEQDGQGEGRWIALDDRLQRRDSDIAAVEIWFCGDTSVGPPPMREVRLPYYSLVERLHQVLNELQMRQVRGGVDDEIFEEVVDNAEQAGFDRGETTNECRVVEFDDEPTDQHRRNDIDSDPPTLRRVAGPDSGPAGDGIEAQLHELSALYQQVRHEFQTVVKDAQTALEERDRYIAHLVGKVEEWQSRFQSDSEAEFDDDELFEKPTPANDELEEMTTIYKSGESDEPDEPDEPKVSDEHEQPDEPAEASGDEAFEDAASSTDDEAADEIADEESEESEGEESEGEESEDAEEQSDESEDKSEEE